jgi:hypothetical protein
MTATHRICFAALTITSHNTSRWRLIARTRAVVQLGGINRIINVQEFVPATKVMKPRGDDGAIETNDDEVSNIFFR